MDFIYDSYSTGNVKTGFILMMLLACVLGLLGLAGVLVPSYIKVKQWISEGWHPFYESVPDGEDQNDDDDNESVAMSRYNRRSSGSGGEGMNKSRSGQWVLDDDDEEEGGGKRAKRQAQKEAKRAAKREKEEKKRREKKEKLRAKLYGK